MATTSKLSMKFADSNGDTVNMNYNHAKSDVSNANVRTLMDGIVANGAIFVKVPTIVKSANVITTESREVDLS